MQDLEREQKIRERTEVLQEKERRAKELRILQALACRGVHSMAQGMAFKTLQRKYPAEWDRIRWG